MNSLHFLATRTATASSLIALVCLTLLATQAQGASWTARGNEPGWLLEISDEAITFTTQEGETLTIEPVPRPIRAEDIEVYATSAEGDAFTLVAANKVCSDAMSGMPHPKTVVVAINGNAFVGCGGEPVSLLVGEWRIEEIAGQPVVAGSETSLSFTLDGSINGNASCNRFFGGFTLTGEGLTLSSGGTTMMACAAELGEQESRFLGALEEVSRFESLSDGRLRLLDVNGKAALTARQW